MGKENREDLLADYAMWARDYAKAVEFYEKFLKSQDHLDVLTSYRIYFDLTIASTLLEKPNSARLYQEKVESYLKRMKTRYIMRGERELPITKVRSRIMKETNPMEMRKLLEEYFPDKEEMLAFFISPRYAKGFLNTMIGNAKRSRAVEVFTRGIFRYTLDPELYRVTARAYSTQELKLEKLSGLDWVRILTKNTSAYYVESERLRIIAGIQREGLVLCQYFLQNFQDTSGANQIHEFIDNISKVFEPGTGGSGIPQLWT